MDYPKKLKSEDRLYSILPYIGQEYTSSKDSGVLTLSILNDYSNKDFSDDFSVILKSLDNISEEDAWEVFCIALGERSRVVKIGADLPKILQSLIDGSEGDDKIKYEKQLAEYESDFEISIHEDQFHVHPKEWKESAGFHFDFWHGHKSLKELHFGFCTANPSSYAEYSCVNPHSIFQYLQKQGYMIPFNGVDLFDDGIAVKKAVK